MSTWKGSKMKKAKRSRSKKSKNEIHDIVHDDEVRDVVDVVAITGGTALVVASPSLTGKVIGAGIAGAGVTDLVVRH